MIELIARRGYQAVRILDLTKLAHVSRPTFYSLYTDKEELFLGAYDEIAGRAAKTVLKAYDVEGSQFERLQIAMRAFAELAAAEPEAMSLVVLGAFGAGAKALERRNRTLEGMEQSIRSSDETPTRSRDRRSGPVPESAHGPHGEGHPRRRPRGDRRPSARGPCERAARARRRARRLGGLLPAEAPRRVEGPFARTAGEIRRCPRPRLRAGAARGGPPAERPPRPAARGHREKPARTDRRRDRGDRRPKGLAGLTIPEIARRANVSHQTFYEMYPTKHDAFLGAQKVGMHQALLVTAEAYEAHEEDWPRAVAAGLRALIDYLSSEPAHAHLSLVDTFAASPEALEIRDSALHAFAAYLGPGYGLAPKDIEVPAIAAEAIAGGIWQVLHHYIENERIGELPDVAPQIIYMALTPFLGPRDAAKAARHPPAR